ncbi:MAG: hypothetical protein NT154_24350, partial [Verrucomicrobia bacterium]|nr:hypothetical protein [Verrucomicrobiota bacterium]
MNNCEQCREHIPPKETRSANRGNQVSRIAIVLMAALMAWIPARAAEEPKAFFLPKSPVAAAYVLGRLSNKELIEAPRSEFVYVALLQRNGLERRYRLEALEGLARLRNKGLLSELIRGISDLDRKGESVEPALRDLASLLLQSKAADLAAERPGLENLASDSKTPLGRQVGYAALVTTAGSADAVWRNAETNSTRLSDLVRSLPLIREVSLRAACYSKVEPLL